VSVSTWVDGRSRNKEGMEWFSVPRCVNGRTRNVSGCLSVDCYQIRCNSLVLYRSTDPSRIQLQYNTMQCPSVHPSSFRSGIKARIPRSL
jgi:hypothetical protein